MQLATIAGSDDATRIWDLQSGEELAALRVPDTVNRDYRRLVLATFSQSGDRLITVTDYRSARIWRRRRPEAWWGIAWMPELWLTLLTATGLVWGTCLDWRSLRKADLV